MEKKRWNSCVVLVAFGAAILVNVASAREEKEYTNSDAATDQISASAAAGVGAIVGNHGAIFLEKGLNSYLRANDAPLLLDDTNIGEIVKKAEQYKTSKLGFGEMGGAEVSIQFDKTAVDNYLARRNLENHFDPKLVEKISKASEKVSSGELRDPTLFTGDSRSGKIGAEAAEDALRVVSKQEPNYKWTEVNLRFDGVEGLEQALKFLQESGASVKNIKYRGSLGKGVRVLGRTGAWIGGALSSLYGIQSFGSFFFSETNPDRVRYRVEREPGIFKRIVNPAAGPAFDTYSANKDRQEKTRRAY